jgi:hypothetical protein
VSEEERKRERRDLVETWLQIAFCHDDVEIEEDAETDGDRIGRVFWIICEAFVGKQ